MPIYPSNDFTLGLSNPVKSRKPPQPPPERERRGKDITPHARRLVRSGAHILETRWGKQNLAFVTLTVPNLPIIDLEWINRSWADIVKRTVEEIGRELTRHGLCREIVHVTEIQEKRYQNSGAIASHIHAVFQGRSRPGAPWAVTKEKLRNIWERVLKSALARPIECPAATRIERVKKSAKRYLGKYMTKGGKIVREIAESGMTAMLPASWWGMTFSLRKTIREQMLNFTMEMTDLIVRHLEDYKAAGLILWGKIITVEYTQSHGEVIEIPVCVCGEFASRDAINMFITNN